MNCSIKKCEREYYCKGVCKKHYMHSFYRRKSSPTRRYIIGDDNSRFDSYVDTSGDCNLWTGSTNGVGYGVFYIQGKNCYAHRFAWQRAVGEIPKGMVLDHLCRNPICVNPQHLEVVTQRENATRGQLATKKSKLPVGVRPHRDTGRFIARARIAGGYNKFLGIYDSEEAASNAYQDFIKSLT